MPPGHGDLIFTVCSLNPPSGFVVPKNPNNFLTKVVVHVVVVVVIALSFPRHSGHGHALCQCLPGPFSTAQIPGLAATALPTFSWTMLPESQANLSCQKKFYYPKN